IFPEDFQLFYDYTKSSVLNFSNPLLDDNTNNIDIDKIYIKKLFTAIFNFNAESAVYHSNSASTYIDGQSAMKFFTNGQIIYSYAAPNPSDINNINTANDINDKGGVQLSRLLGYDAGGSYTFYEKIKAASIFVNGLPAELTGGELAGGTGSSLYLYLKSITTDKNQNLNITFAYYFKGIEIKINGYDYGVLIVMNSDSITDVTLNSFYVTLGETVRNINPVIILSEFDDMISKDIKNGATAAEKENIAGKYKFEYDKNQDKFIVNKIDLNYNINYTNPASERRAEAQWVIR
ncbi:MAG: hypothetical protein FWD71_16955, partial [Oscillospiraceae bacterium]|nr:hypothetical protein [Oscillospiraceae bacterium]